MPGVLVFHSQRSKEAEQMLLRYFPGKLNKAKNVPVERHAFVQVRAKLKLGAEPRMLPRDVFRASLQRTETESSLHVPGV